MKVETYKCDVCGTMKGETNHWFVGYFDPDSRAVTVGIWQTNVLTDPGVTTEHLCGLDCAGKWVIRNLEKFNG